MINRARKPRAKRLASREREEAARFRALERERGQYAALWLLQRWSPQRAMPSRTRVPLSASNFGVDRWHHHYMVEQAAHKETLQRSTIFNHHGNANHLTLL